MTNRKVDLRGAKDMSFKLQEVSSQAHMPRPDIFKRWLFAGKNHLKRKAPKVIFPACPDATGMLFSRLPVMDYGLYFAMGRKPKSRVPAR